MPNIVVNEIEFYYERHGSGDPLILICGFTNHLGMWKRFIPKLSASFEVIVFDNRGAGRTESSPPPYTIEMLADDVIGLMDALEIQRAQMAGFSMGSLIIQSIGHRHAERIHKGVLIAPFSVLPSTALMQAHSVAKLFQAGVNPALALETMLPWIYSNDYLSDPKRVIRTIDTLLKNPYPQPPEGYAGQLQALSQCDMSDRLAAIETPLLILAGEEDLYTPFYEAKLLREQLPNAVLKGVPGVGHMLYIEAEEITMEGFMPFAPANGINLYYETYGKGKPIVFLSGFSTHHLTWQSFIEPLQDNFQLILLDNRGAGQTTAPATPYSIDSMADDTVALMDHLKIDVASMVGSSMGTAIIQTIAHRAPKRIDKGVLIAPFSKLPRVSLLKTLTTGKLLQAGVPLDLVVETVIPWLFSRDFVASPEKVAAKKEEMTKNPFPQSIEGFLGQMHALETFDSSQFIKQLEAEFFLIAGEEDLSTPFSCAQFLHEHLAKSTLHPFSRMGHMAHAEKRDEVLALIQKFIKV